MRSTKFFILLALFAASTAMVSAQATDDHQVSTTLTETRTVTLGGVAPSIAVKKSAAPLWYSDTGSTITINHDLAVTQEVVVETNSVVGTETEWEGRYLEVRLPALAPINTMGLGPAPTPAGWVPLIDGSLAAAARTVTEGAPAILVGNISATDDGAGNPGASPALPLEYRARADTTAVVAAAADVVTVTYTIQDQ